jgi:hypothetical protein
MFRNSKRNVVEAPATDAVSQAKTVRNACLFSGAERADGILFTAIVTELEKLTTDQNVNAESLRPVIRAAIEFVENNRHPFYGDIRSYIDPQSVTAIKEWLTSHSPDRPNNKPERCTFDPSVS